jgi:2-keto-4-pentenoate hydratase/2-oxohepta-3-ene-1,7-dioic acid hydratase in catechol pathway
MRLVTFEVGGGGQRLGAVAGDQVVDLSAVAAGLGREAGAVQSALALLGAGARGLDLAGELVEAAGRGEAAWRRPLADLRLRAPIPQPPKVLCMAGNYAEHWREAGLTAPPRDNFAPQLFIKPVTTIVGPEDPIVLPGPICTAVDYEGELVAVIGKAGYRIPAGQALEHVAGYANFNDVSGRKLTIDTPRPDNPRTAYFDWLNGKWFDTFGPLGPYLVTADEVPDPQALAIQTRVNGQVRQRASTGDMIFTLAETIEFISLFLTLEPGDLIATGTPSGVGSTTKTFLQPGDVVEVEVEKLGVLRNPVVAPRARSL